MSVLARFLFCGLSLLAWSFGCGSGRNGGEGDEYVSRMDYTTIPEQISIDYRHTEPLDSLTPFSPQNYGFIELSKSCTTSVKIYNIYGEVIRTLVTDAYLEAGRYKVVWDGYDDSGESVASGVYFLHLTACEYEGKKKLFLLK